MKKYINRKLYDTETARKCGEYEPNPYRSDFSWYCETLYQKRTGEFFLHGDGNAASPYSKSCGQNEWTGSEAIKPLTYEEAQKWAEEHLTGDEYIAIFGEPAEDERAQLNLHISAAVIQKLKRIATERGVSAGSLVEELVTKHL